MTQNKTPEPIGPGTTHQSNNSDGGTTRLIDDAAAEAVTVGSDQLRSQIITATTIVGSQTLSDFFKKPTRLAAGLFTASDTTRTTPIAVDQVLLTTAAKFSKFSGNLMWRGDIVLRLQANATRFQTGRYILAWFPTCGTLFSDPSAAALYRMHSCNLMQLTQLPHIEIDLAKQTSVELRIPFTSMYAFHDITPTGSSMGLGACFIFPYTKLAAGSGSSSAPYVLWGHLENVILSGPTVTQSSQGGKDMTGVNVMKPVPSSKTRHDSVAVRQHRSNVPYAASLDHQTMSQTMATTNKTNIPMSVGQGDGHPVTNINWIKQRPAHFKTVVWKTTDTSDTPLTAIAHNPAISQAYDKGFTYTPIGFLSTMFKLWRGSIIVRFKLVKNEFYSGRLALAYLPSYKKTVLPSNKASTSEYAFREIIDIRDTSEFEVRLPYISPEMFTSMTDNVGYLLVDVLDPLIAPSSVDQNITILMEVMGGDDLTFQYPLPANLRPWAPITVQSGTLVETETPRVTFNVPHNAINTMINGATTGEEINDLLVFIKRFAMNPGPRLAPTSTNIIPELIFPFFWNVSSQSSTTPFPLLKDTFRSDLITRFACCYGMSSGGIRILVEPWEDDPDDVLEIGMDYDSSLIPTTLVSFPTSYEVNPHAVRLPFNTRIDGIMDVTLPAYSRLMARSTSAQLICATDPTIRPTLARNSKMTYLSVQNLTTTASTAKAYQFHRMGADDFNYHVWLGTVPMTTDAAT